MINNLMVCCCSATTKTTTKTSTSITIKFMYNSYVTDMKSEKGIPVMQSCFDNNKNQIFADKLLD